MITTVPTLLVFASATAAADRPTPPSDRAVAPPAYRIRLELPRDEYLLGETLDARVTLENTSDRTIYLADPLRDESALALAFHVRNLKSGEILRRWDLRDPHDRWQAGILELGPGQSAAVVDPVFLDAIIPPSKNYLPPGEYEITALYENVQRVVGQFVGRTPADVHAEVRSDPVRFRVTPPTREHEVLFAAFRRALVDGPFDMQLERVGNVLSHGDLPENFRLRMLIYEASIHEAREDLRAMAAALEEAARIDSPLREIALVRLGRAHIDLKDEAEARKWLSQSSLPVARRLQSALAPADPARDARR